MNILNSLQTNFVVFKKIFFTWSHLVLMTTLGTRFWVDNRHHVTGGERERWNAQVTKPLSRRARIRVLVAITFIIIIIIIIIIMIINIDFLTYFSAFSSLLSCTQRFLECLCPWATSVYPGLGSIGSLTGSLTFMVAGRGWKPGPGSPGLFPLPEARPEWDG